MDSVRIPGVVAAEKWSRHGEKMQAPWNPTRNLFLLSFCLVRSEILLGWRPGLRLPFNILTNAILRYFIHLFCQLFCLGYLAQLNATAAPRHTLPETDGLLSWDPRVVWPALAAVWLIHGVVARSSPLQSGTHKQMYMTFWFDSLDPGGSFSSPGSLDSRMSQMESRHRAHTRRRGRLCFAVGTGITTADFDLLNILWLKPDELTAVIRNLKNVQSNAWLDFVSSAPCWNFDLNCSLLVVFAVAPPASWSTTASWSWWNISKHGTFSFWLVEPAAAL